MKCNVLTRNEIYIKPGDKVKLDIDCSPFGRPTTVKRLVETRHGVYVVFTNSTWRPLSTHGITWEKVG